MRLRHLLPLLAVGAVLSVPAAAGATTVRDGVVYGHARGPGGHRVALKLDVYLPDGATKRRPAIVWIHGGGFTEGDRKGMGNYAQEFANRGYVTTSIEYRLATPAALKRRGYTSVIGDARRDAQASIRWVRGHAASLGVDPNRVFVGGYSAGAVIATHVAEHPTTGSAVAGAIILAGGGDLDAFDRNDAPLLMFHGTADESVPYSWARETCAAARHAGSGCTFVTFRGAHHDLPFTHFPQIVGRIASWLAART